MITIKCPKYVDLLLLGLFRLISSLFLLVIIIITSIITGLLTGISTFISGLITLKKYKGGVNLLSDKWLKLQQFKKSMKGL